MKETYKEEHNIRGVRKFYEMSKEVKNFPGFAPTEFEVKIGDIVVEYRDFKPYFQPENDCPNLEIDEVERILTLLKTPTQRKKLHDLLGWGYPLELIRGDSFQSVYSCRFCDKELAQDSTGAYFHL